MRDHPPTGDEARMKDNGDAKDDSERHPITRRLLEARSVLLFGPIEPTSTQKIITQLLVLNQMDGKEPIRLYINSPGGYADDGFAIYDVMNFVAAPVYTICSGIAASAATIVMVGGEKGHRYTLPHSRLMLHQPSSGARGSASDIAVTAKEILRLREKGNELYAKETGHKIEKIREDLHRDFWMTAEEAVGYGLADKIVEAEKDIGKR